MMVAMHSHPLVEDYLRRLEEEARRLPADRRTELLADIREHLDDALRGVDTADEAAVRNAVERLGSPEEIVREAAGPQPAPAPGHGRLEVGAIVMIAVGGLVVPVLGWLVGAVLVVSSRFWTSTEKLRGLAPLLIGPLLGAVVVIAISAAPEGSARDGGGGLGTAEIAAIVIWVGAGFVSAGYLASRLRAR
jgi:HAAS domain-containing protein